MNCGYCEHHYELLDVCMLVKGLRVTNSVQIMFRKFGPILRKAA